MIKDASTMQKALKKGLFAGVILYQGKSALDGAPIVVIANRITNASNNEKTGHMVQTWILRSDMSPQEAINQGLDSSICGDCMHRPENRGSCYVNIGYAPRSTYEAFKRKRYAIIGKDFCASIVPALFAGLIVRLGSYGDPCAAPFQTWRAMTLNTRAVNGYSHQWRNKRFKAFSSLCMASADSEQEAQEAQALGWRTFRVRAASAPIMARESICPASEEAGKKTQCASCRACGGNSAKARVNIAIIAHGTTKKRFAEQGVVA
jgi:hypothetical protein